MVEHFLVGELAGAREGVFGEGCLVKECLLEVRSLCVGGECAWLAVTVVVYG